MRTATERASDKIPDAIHAARVQAVAQALGSQALGSQE
jgi:hypothetical protein